jgi:hypothetical protein
MQPTAAVPLKHGETACDTSVKQVIQRRLFAEIPHELSFDEVINDTPT